MGQVRLACESILRLNSESLRHLYKSRNCAAEYQHHLAYNRNSALVAPLHRGRNWWNVGANNESGYSASQD